MAEYKISINQLARFSKSTDNKKRSIVKQQKNPPKVLVARYGLAKARIRKAIANYGNIQPILDGIQELKSRNPETPLAISDKAVSIEAMERFIKMKLPSFLNDNVYEVLKKPKVNSFVVSDVEIIVSADLIIKVFIDGQAFLGGVKLHIAKGDIFDREQAKYVSTCLYQYLDLVFENSGIIVLPQLCLSVDVFAESFFTAPENIEKTLEDIETMCLEIKRIWPNV
ncbi:hypothetical protein [Flavobacterium terrisoli]|uniref:hypothetical protein n=1 Tax=Flavobacterium terrisoli TaxID=3242195 RepID=UPI0025434EB5|nr:hypothetical protein [Flavobacterium buctense]